MSTVALVRCDSYDETAVSAAVRRGIQLLGGPEKFARKNEKILLKVNLLAGDAPEKCTATHPAVFTAVAKVMMATGAIVSCGDSPSFGSTAAVAKKTGIARAAEQLGVEIKDFSIGKEVAFPEGKQNKKFTIATPVLESDGIISLPKLKTHGFVKFTGAVKNQFGCIPGMLKAEFHVKMTDPVSFARMLVDCNRLVHPRLYVMDGIMAMEGNGPRGGAPRKMNVLLFSEDPVAMDATACRLINLDPGLVPTITLGRECGHGSCDEKEITLVGDDFALFKAARFVVDRMPIRPFRAEGIARVVNNIFVPKPVIKKSKCVRCGHCVTICPVRPKAIDWCNNDRSRPPRHAYDRCIRCYCCQEVCPEKAITLRKPLLRLLFSF